MDRSLDDAVAAGEPLIDLVVSFVHGIDYVRATNILNSLGDDIEFHAKPWYDEDHLRLGQVTAEGALKHFNARFSRIPLDKWNPETGRYEGYSSDYFRWSDTAITEWPDELVGLIKTIGATQPGANDDGQPYTPIFARSSSA